MWRSLVLAVAFLCAGCPDRCGGAQQPASEPDEALVPTGPGLRPGSPGEGEDTVVDSYCGVRLRRGEAAATFEHRGHTYSFCLRDHMEAFRRDPDRYLRDLTEAEQDAGSPADSAPASLDGGLRAEDGG